MKVLFSVPRIRSACAVGLLLLSQQAAHSQAAPQNQLPQQETAPKRPTLRQTTIPDAFTGLPFHASVQAADGYGDVVMTLRGALPAGLTLQTGAKTLAVSGIPEAPGTVDLEVTATDSDGNIARGSYTMRVLPHPLSGPPTAVIPDAETIHTTDTKNVFFPAVIKTNEIIAADDTDHVFMPVIINVKETIAAADADNHFSPATITNPESIHTTDTIAVVKKLGITPTTTSAGSYNVGYAQTFNIVGNTGAATLTPSGTLPTGLSFSGSGSSRTLSGTPSQVGNFSFTLTAIDSANVTTINYSLVINKGTQNINFPQPTSPVTYTTGLSSTLTATSSLGAGYPVSYSVTGPATLSGSTLTYTGPGTVVVTATQAGDANIAAATPIQVTIVVNTKTPSVFLANSNSTVSSVSDTLTAQNPAAAGGGVGVAVDAAGYVWSINSAGNGLARVTDLGTLSGFYTPVGISGATALAIDGNSNLWIANGNGTLTRTSTAGAALSTSHDSTGTAASSIAIDISGNIWLSNRTANTVDEIIGGAAPSQPLATAVTNDTPATKP